MRKAELYDRNIKAKRRPLIMNNFAYKKRREDALDEFKFILENYIFPLLQFDGKPHLKTAETRSTNLKKHIKLYNRGSNYYLHFFPSLSTPQFHYHVKINNPNQELGAAEQALREILRVSQFNYGDRKFSMVKYHDKEDKVYRKSRFDVAFEIGLCNWLGSECIYTLIQRLREWSQKTYEGSRMSFGFIIDATKTTCGEVDYLNFLKSDHSAVFTDGIYSGIKLDNAGRVVKYFSALQEYPEDNDKHIPWTPYEFINFANMCRSENKSNWIGIIMQSSGDMLIFKSKQLIFVKKNGKWMYLDSYAIHSILKSNYNSNSMSTSDIDEKKLADEVYLSILDTAFAHTGGCIAIIKDEYIDFVKENCFPTDSLDNEQTSSDKKTIINRLISAGTINGEKQYFQYLDRKLRIELLSLDGATVLDSSGKILCAGAIVKIDGGSEGGGRLAATKELAKYGFATKISMDGSIQCFSLNDTTKEVCEVFKAFRSDFVNSDNLRDKNKNEKHSKIY